MHEATNRARWAIAMCAAAAVLAACANWKDDVLQPQNPGIVDQSAVGSPAAAAALKVGAMGALKRVYADPAPTGFAGSSIWEASGLMSDEFMNSDFQNSQNDVDARTMSPDNTVSDYTRLTQARGYIRDAIAAEQQFEPQKTADIGELHMALGFIEMTLAENFCNGIPLGSNDRGVVDYSGPDFKPFTYAEVFDIALSHIDSALTIIGAAVDSNSVAVRNASLIVKARILVDKGGQLPQAAGIVTSIPSNYQYLFITQASTNNDDSGLWTLNNSISRTLAGKADYEDGKLKSFMSANFLYGTGRIDQRKVVVGGDDFTIRGGAADAGIRGKQIHAEQMANSLQLPMVRLVDGTGGGGSVKMLERYGYTYVPANPAWNYVVDNMSLVPVVAACMGSVAGLGAARVVTSHFSLLVEPTAQLFTAGPPVVKFATGEVLSKEELGGAQIHRKSGVVDVVVASEEEAFRQIRGFLSYLPSSVFQLPPVQPCADPADRRDEKLLSAVPRNRRQPVKIRPVLAAIFDAGSVFELARYGGPIVTALARLDGHPVGVIASDPYVGGGVLTVEGSDAMIRLIDLCQTFHLPVVVMTDQPGIAVGTYAERRGTIRYAARAVAAVYQASVPTAEIIIRKCFGVGGAGMTNRHAYVQRYAWPSGDWGSLPVEGGLEAAYRSELEASDDREGLLEDIRSRLEAVRSPFRTAENFGVEEIIDPRDTRPLLCDWVRDAYALLPAQLGRPSHGTRP